MPTQKTVVIADDNQEFLIALTRQIEDLGIKVSPATDGLEAVMHTAAAKPDLIILDNIMPGADGLNVCEMLGANASTSDIPIIILTGKSDAQTRQRCKSLGAHYVFKNLEYWDNLT